MSGESFAAGFYYAREGVLATGFLLYAAFARFRRTRSLSSEMAHGLRIAAFVLFAGCTLGLQMSDLLAVRIVSVFVIALLIGMSGGMVYERIALVAQQVASSGALGKLQMRGALSDDSACVLGVVVGGGGALAVVAHYILQIVLALSVLLSICFVICFGLLMWLASKLLVHLSPSAQDGDAGTRDGGNEVGRTSVGATSVVCMVVASVCLFGLLLFYEVVLRGMGATAYFYEWHRLFVAVGYIAIGALAYFGGRSYASIAVLVAMLFVVVVLMQTVMLEAGPFTAVLYYVLLGAIIAWSGIMFMSAAAQSSHPALVASAGRVLSAIVTAVGIIIPADVAYPVIAVLIVALVMLAVVIVSMVKGGFLVFPEQDANSAGLLRGDDVPSAEERVQMLAHEHSLTTREQEVLAALVLTEEKNQQIADNLGISRRQLQTHISRIYEKTGTTTRAGLVMRVNGNTE